MNLKATVLHLTLLVVTACGSAFADAIFTLGNHPQPDEQNVLFNTSQEGNPVFGHTNQSDTTVDFFSTTDILSAKGGQAHLEAVDGLLNDVKISVPGFTFADLIFNPFKPTADSDLMVTVTTTDGNVFTETYGSKNGNNFLTITTSGGERIKDVTIDSSGGFQDLDQVRVSGLAKVPEPTALILFGSGIAGLGGLLRRKRQ